MESSEAEQGKMTRRQMLRLVTFSAVGAGIVLSGHTLVAKAFPEPSQENLGKTPGSPSPSNTTSASTSASSSSATSGAAAESSATGIASSPEQVKVKVMYFQMPLIVRTSEEYFSLPSPAYYRDLLADVLENHPALSPLMSSMMILIDGVLAQPGTPLRNGDEVDFIPAIAGG